MFGRKGDYPLRILDESIQIHPLEDESYLTRSNTFTTPEVNVDNVGLIYMQGEKGAMSESGKYPSFTLNKDLSVVYGQEKDFADMDLYSINIFRSGYLKRPSAGIWVLANFPNGENFSSWLDLHRVSEKSSSFLSYTGVWTNKRMQGNKYRMYLPLDKDIISSIYFSFYMGGNAPPHSRVTNFRR